MLLRLIDTANPEEVVFVFACRTHPEVAKWLMGKPPVSLEAHRQWLATHVSSKYIRGRDST